MILKTLFSSTTRVKILQLFLSHPEKEYFIRELTRLLDEQINSVRRELESLKKIGLFKTRTRNRKKYYMLNKDFVVLHELKSLVVKAMGASRYHKKDITNLGEVDVALLSGKFINKDDKHLDLFLVGNVDKKELDEYIASASESKETEFRCMVMNKEDYLYRLECKDTFISEIFSDKENIILINKVKSPV